MRRLVSLLVLWCLGCPGGDALVVVESSVSSPITEPGAVEIRALPLPGAQVDRVDFYRAGALVGSDAQAPFSHSFEVGTADSGVSWWYAVSIDDRGKPRVSGNVILLEVELAGGTSMPCPSEAATQIALDARLIWFDPELDGGAHTWVFEGGEFGKAAVSFCGDARGDGPLLEQARYVLRPGNGLTATGAFQDQKQLGTTAMFTLMKSIPRVWNQLSDEEQTRIELMVKGALVSSTFTTSDHNPFIVAGTKQYALNGDGNIGRGWAPNFRNGMLGTVIVATAFLGVEAAQDFLLGYDHDAFLDQLEDHDLPNLLSTYESSDPDTPTAQQIEATHHRPYRYLGIPHADLMGLYLRVTQSTYLGTVECGLNDNDGVVGPRNGVVGGYVVHCNGIPNLGAEGMLSEFHGSDGWGVRSSAHYANDGWYVNNYIHYVLVALGLWEDSAEAREVTRRIEVGTADLRFKIHPDLGGGYRNLHNGSGGSSLERWSNGYGHTINFSIAEDVLEPLHR
jgi:hypothetical protein